MDDEAYRAALAAPPPEEYPELFTDPPKRSRRKLFYILAIGVVLALVASIAFNEYSRSADPARELVVTETAAEGLFIDGLVLDAETCGDALCLAVDGQQHTLVVPSGSGVEPGWFVSARCIVQGSQCVTEEVQSFPGGLE